MSNIYIQEPPTSGKVLLKTTVGDIDIELWARECPKTCRNFVQLCLEGYFNKTTFHRLVKGFIVQGGDPNGDGTGGASIYGHPFKDEFHSRLRYSRRGLVGMANSGKDDNTSQFFFTLGPTPELENRNTLFGKVTGDTIFNMLKLEEGIIDHQERPMYAHRIISTEVLSAPFGDIVPRILQTVSTKCKKSKKEKKGVKNFGLLSFGSEAEDDEQKTIIFVKQIAGKAKSLHDATNDSKLSKEPIKITQIEQAQSEEYLPRDCNDPAVQSTSNSFDIVKYKLSKHSTLVKSTKEQIKSDLEDGDDDKFMTQEQVKSLKISTTKSKIREEIKLLKRQYQMDKVSKVKQVSKSEASSKIGGLKGASENHYINNFIQTKEAYAVKTKSNQRGQSREEFTLNMLSKFRSKLGNIKEKSSFNNGKTEQTALNDCIVEKEINGEKWMSHTLNFDSNIPVLAKDASTKNDDWYDVCDPRNSLNKRKRGETEDSKSVIKSKYRRN